MVRDSDVLPPDRDPRVPPTSVRSHTSVLRAPHTRVRPHTDTMSVLQRYLCDFIRTETTRVDLAERHTRR